MASSCASRNLDGISGNVSWLKHCRLLEHASHGSVGVTIPGNAQKTYRCDTWHDLEGDMVPGLQLGLVSWKSDSALVTIVINIELVQLGAQGPSLWTFLDHISNIPVFTENSCSNLFVTLVKSIKKG